MGCAASSTASTVASPAVEPQLKAGIELLQEKPASRESAPGSRPSSPLECMAPVPIANMKIVGGIDGLPEAAASAPEAEAVRQLTELPMCLNALDDCHVVCLLHLPTKD